MQPVTTTTKPNVISIKSIVSVSSAGQPHPLRHHTRRKYGQKRQVKVLHKWRIQRIDKGVAYR